MGIIGISIGIVGIIIVSFGWRRGWFHRRVEVRMMDEDMLP